MRTSKTLTVKGNKYEILQLDGERAIEGLVVIGNVIGQPLGDLISVIFQTPKGSDEKRSLNSIVETLEYDKVGDLISKTLLKLDRKDVKDLMTLLLASVTFAGEEMHMKHAHFHGNLKLMFKLAMESFKANYQDFLLENFGVLAAAEVGGQPTTSDTPT